MKTCRVIFFGTPEFAVPALEALIQDERFDVVAVVTESDRKAGRGKKVVFSPIKLVAMKYSIPVLQSETISSISYKLKAKSCDVAVVCAYGQFIPKDILDIPKYGFVNIHPSLLPKYRGPAPIQTAILNGDNKTGVSIMKIDTRMDHGPILANRKSLIANRNSQQLSEKLSKLGAELLIKTLPDYLEGKIKLKPQNHKKATFTKLIKKENGLIDWKEPVEIIERKFRAYYPWPGTYTFLGNKRLKILKAHLKKPASATPEVEVGKNNNSVKLVFDQVQMEGKKPISWEEFKRGYRQKIDISDKIMI